MLTDFYCHEFTFRGQVLSVLTKGLFAAAVMDIHLDLFEQARRSQASIRELQRVNEARRNFMKYPSRFCIVKMDMVCRGTFIIVAVCP